MDQIEQGISHPNGVGGRLRLMGPARFERSDGSSTPLEDKDALLLALLALDGQRSRQQLAALLWPDVPGERARGNLRQRLLRLRRLLGDEVVIGSHVLMLSPRISVDARDISDQLPEAEGASFGDLLAGMDTDALDTLGQWLEAARRQHRAKCIDGLLACAGRCADSRDPAGAVAFIERALALEPTDESLHVRLMQAYYELGNRSAALATYERCEQVLADQLGVEPGPQARALKRLALASAPPAPPTSPASGSVQAWRSAVARPPRLVGRSGPWRTLLAALSSGNCALLTGPGGIGKSRMLGEWVTQAPDRLSICARPGDEWVPYGLVARLLRECGRRWSPGLSDEAVRAELARLLPEWGQAPTAPASQTRIGWAIGAALQRWHTQGLRGLAFDDLQHADASSLAWLLPWSTERERPEVAVVLASREAEMPIVLREWAQAHEAGLPAEDLLPSPSNGSPPTSAQRSVERIALHPLTLPDLEALLTDIQEALGPLLPSLPSAEALSRHTGGNPWFVLRTLRLLGEQAAASPGTSQIGLPAAHELKTLLARQLAQLSPRALALAQVAAMAGEAFDAELASATLSVSAFELAPPWRELESAQWMTGGRLTHDLIGEAALESIPASLQPQLHAAIAAKLASRQTPPSILARHWHAASQWAEAATAYEAAAAESALRNAVAEQLASLDAAAECHRRNPGARPGAAFDCALQAANLTIEQLQSSAAIQRCQDLLALATADTQRAAAWQIQARAHLEAGDYPLALDAANHALELLDPSSDDRTRVLAHLYRASALTRLGQGAQALGDLDPSSPALQRLSVDDRLAWLTEYATLLDLADRRQESVATLGHLAQEAERAQRWVSAGAAYCNQSVALMYLGRTAAGRQAVEAGLACYGHSTLGASALLVDKMNLAGFLRDQGHFREYLKLAEPLPAGLLDAGYLLWSVNADNDLAVTYCWLGRTDLAYRIVHGDLPPDSPRLAGALRLMVKASLARDHGVSLHNGERHADLTRQAAAILRKEGALGRNYIRLKVALECARADGAAADDTELAAIEQEAEQREQYMLLAHVRLLRIQMAQARGSSAAAPMAHRLLEQCERDGMPPGLYPPQVWSTIAQALRDSDPRTSDAVLLLARQWITDIAAQQVPELFQHSFLHGNRTNRAILGSRPSRTPHSP